MSQELILKSLELFDTSVKWNAFVDLVSIKGDIQRYWLNKLMEAAQKSFSTTEYVEGWSFQPISNWDCCWYISEFGIDSVRIYYGWEGGIALYSNPGINDIEKLHRLLKDEKYLPIINCFERRDGFLEGNRLIYENRNFSFNTPLDTRYDAERLTWFAGNRTEDFLQQIVDKVNKFRKNPEICSLLKELNIKSPKIKE